MVKCLMIREEETQISCKLGVMVEIGKLVHDHDGTFKDRQ